MNVYSRHTIARNFAFKKLFITELNFFGIKIFLWPCLDLMLDAYQNSFKLIQRFKRKEVIDRDTCIIIILRKNKEIKLVNCTRNDLIKQTDR